MTDVKGARLIADLLARYDPPGHTFVEYVKNGYGMLGVFVHWEDAGSEYCDLWWFGDASLFDLTLVDEAKGL